MTYAPPRMTRTAPPRFAPTAAPATDLPTAWLRTLTTMSQWRSYFDEHQQLSPDDVGAVQAMDAGTRAAIVRSIRRFQIGERNGSRIASDVRSAPDSFLNPDSRHAIPLYIAEEHRHAELLGTILRRMDADVVEHDLSASAFRFVRTLLGLRAKIVVLNVAEIIGATFYGSVVDFTEDRSIKHVLTAIRDDELAHLAFGVVLIRQIIDAPGSRLTKLARRIALTAWFRLVLLAALVVLSVDHMPYLRRAGFVSVWRPALAQMSWFTRALSARPSSG